MKVCVLPWEVPIAPSGSLFQSVMDQFPKSTTLANVITTTLVDDGDDDDNNNNNNGTQHTKARLREFLNEKWRNKLMHGQCIRNMDTQLISEEDTFLWLSRGDQKKKLKVK